ncbi:MAG: Nucleoside diphosphate kinase [Candidatus Uhrbacteria bacterium GW2011_GWE2_45_35]|uniref:nucleoside-diphosphate kinase n=2 Tax=Candidatus Uhriibacteriota TaxID=1752732 RepID=A0A0G1JJZ8_9BACT|nr:MAG: Nucleoside diphosphate kinase [Candidatus Uhrbacteria bacterium GW2011_GWF2_44_350]KKU08390.1 MAG: Nucleoside diphosphate kinase [Candidatus Uhrbacteria bacterium GW2011_GWE2_45_35]
MVKPDGVKKGLIGEIIRRFEQRDLKIIALEMFQPTTEQIDNHYPKDETWIRRLGQKTLGTYEKYGIDPVEKLGTADDLELGKMVRGWLINYMVSAPLVRMVVEGVHAVDMVRKICGATLPYLADMGTIRGDYSADSPAVANSEHRAVMNLVHASETTTEAEHEIEHWFGNREVIFNYDRFQ